MLAVIETHPVQYHAPVYRRLQQACGVPVTAIYGSDFSLAGYRDKEFNSTFSWDTDLVSGYTATFLSRVNGTVVSDADAIPTRGMLSALSAATPDAVMVLGYSPRFNQAAWLAALRLRRPILFRGETTNLGQRGGFSGTAKSVALRAAYRRCAGVLYIGSRSRAHFEAHGVPAARLFFSPYCVDTSPFEADDAAREKWRDATRADLGIAPSALVLMYAGKVSHRKGIDLLVPSIEALPEDIRRRIVLLVVGNGDLNDELRASAERVGLAIRMVGFQNQSALSRYYHAADLFVLPSRRSETWGLVVNESLLHGVPAVVSDRVGCAVDLVRPGDTGELFAADSLSSLTNALVTAMPLAGHAAVRAACRRRLEDYSVANAAAGIADAYHHATGKRP